MKIGTIVILVVIVIAALIIGLRKADIIGGAKVPEEVLQREVEAIDVETHEIIKVTVNDWERKYKTDEATGYKIGDGGRKLSVPLTCASCQVKIPTMPRQPGLEPEQEEKAMMEYKCPKCGGRAYNLGY